MALYFTAWREASLVVHDTISKLSPGTTPMPANALQPVMCRRRSTATALISAWHRTDRDRAFRRFSSGPTGRGSRHHQAHRAASALDRYFTISDIDINIGVQGASGTTWQQVTMTGVRSMLAGDIVRVRQQQPAR
jgi:hypothetical protein